MVNPSITKLSNLAAKSHKTIIGLMSGTSLDGLDIALCTVSESGPQTTVDLQEFTTINYPAELKQRLAKITSVPEVSLEEVCLQHSRLGEYHGELILKALSTWSVLPEEVDCIASHGQTIYHAPATQHGDPEMPNATLQIGDGDHIARTTGILTISDFRQKHTAAGGEGAPMAAFVDRLLFADEEEDRILLNIGGIANFTLLSMDNLGEIRSITTDTGPGNTLIDAAMRRYFDRDFDNNGEVARRGSVDKAVLSALKADPYFAKPLPKTTGPEVFNLTWLEGRLDQTGVELPSPEDLIATLTRLSAETVSDTVKEVTDNGCTIYGSGGGIHNTMLREWMSELLPGFHLRPFETIGFNPDAKEAVIFAVLANEMLSGDGFAMDEHKINFGKLSFPK